MIAHEAISLPPWVDAPKKLVSLWDMIQFRADGVLLVVRVLETFHAMGQAIARARQNKQSITPELTEEHSREWAKNVQNALGVLEKLSVSASRKQIERIAIRLENGEGLDVVSGDIKEALSRLRDELEDIVFFTVAPSKTKLMDKPRSGWDSVLDRFPAAITDIEEASRCLALDRASACVFHLMRVMEHGLVAVAAGLGIPYAPSWESYLKQIDNELRTDWKDKTPTWKQSEEFYREVAAHLSTVKFAWRNPTMHIRRSYTPDEAAEVYNSVRGFMRHLATQLSETMP